jgi:hypothetical protein
VVEHSADPAICGLRITSQQHYYSYSIKNYAWYVKTYYREPLNPFQLSDELFYIGAVLFQMMTQSLLRNLFPECYQILIIDKPSLDFGGEADSTLGY